MGPPGSEEHRSLRPRSSPRITTPATWFHGHAGGEIESDREGFNGASPGESAEEEEEEKAEAERKDNDYAGEEIGSESEGFSGALSSESAEEEEERAETEAEDPNRRIKRRMTIRRCDRCVLRDRACDQKEPCTRCTNDSEGKSRTRTVARGHRIASDDFI